MWAHGACMLLVALNLGPAHASLAAGALICVLGGCRYDMQFDCKWAYFQAVESLAQKLGLAQV